MFCQFEDYLVSGSNTYSLQCDIVVMDTYSVIVKPNHQLNPFFNSLPEPIDFIAVTLGYDQWNLMEQSMGLDDV